MTPQRVRAVKAERLVRRRFVVLGCLVAVLVSGALLAAGSAQAASMTYTVDSTADSNLTACDAATAGDCTLRGAINAANANPGADTIDFSIPGAGVKTITSSTSSLPDITDRVTIDGYTQSGAIANTNTRAQGDNAVLRIELTGTRSSLTIRGGVATGGSGTTIRGLAANGSSSDQIQISASNVTIEGDFIGLDPTGTTAKPSGNYGIRQTADFVGEAANNNTIGGVTDGARNVISGNQNGGIILVDGGPTVVQGNYIGPNAAGTAAFATGGDGINVLGGSPFTVNSTSIVGNLISGNPNGGIAMNSGGVIQANLIGTQRDGTSALGNKNFGGINLGLNDDVAVGGMGPGAANTIAFNASSGVAVQDNSSKKAILGNSIYSNGEDSGGLGISLTGGVGGPLANDPGDGDSVFGNLGQNYPVITSAAVSAGHAIVSGTLNSTASKTFRLEFFSNQACNTPSPTPGAPASDFGEGQTFLGSTSVTTDASGNASFGPLSLPVPAGQAVITSTATDPSNNTSEFSKCLTAAAPANAPPTANNDSYATDQNHALNVAAPGVLANDTDNEHDPLTAAKVSGPAHGTLTLNSNGSFSYTPNPNYAGPDSFTYQANDGSANSNTATVSLNVRAVAPANTAPSAKDDSYKTNENQTIHIAPPGVLKNDSDPNHDPLTAQLVQGPRHGSLILRADGGLRYVPKHDFSGTDSFTYHVSDGRGGTSNTATVHLTVNAAQCVVPQLLHKTLDQAKRLLSSHHCKLGKVTGARDGRVERYRPRAGTILRSGLRVAVHLRGVAPHPSPRFTG